MISIKRIPQDPYETTRGSLPAPPATHPRYVGKEDGSVEPQKIHTVVISTQHAEPSKAVRSKVRSGLDGGVQSGWQWMRLVEVAWWVPVSLGGKKPEGYGSRIFFPGEWTILACGFLFHMFFVFLTRSFVESQVRLFLFYFWTKRVRKDTV